MNKPTNLFYLGRAPTRVNLTHFFHSFLAIVAALTLSVTAINSFRHVFIYGLGL